MNPLYDLNSWSNHYREEALRRAQRRALTEQARINRAPRSEGSRTERITKLTLSLLRRAHPA